MVALNLIASVNIKKLDIINLLMEDWMLKHFKRADCSVGCWGWLHWGLTPKENINRLSKSTDSSQLAAAWLHPYQIWSKPQSATGGLSLRNLDGLCVACWSRQHTLGISSALWLPERPAAICLQPGKCTGETKSCTQPSRAVPKHCTPHPWKALPFKISRQKSLGGRECMSKRASRLIRDGT